MTGSAGSRQHSLVVRRADRQSEYLATASPKARRFLNRSPDGYIKALRSLRTLAVSYTYGAWLRTCADQARHRPAAIYPSIVRERVCGTRAASESKSLLSVGTVSPGE
jgi:hypothetical protein